MRVITISGTLLLSALALSGCDKSDGGSTASTVAAAAPVVDAAAKYCQVDWQGAKNLDEMSEHYEARIRHKCHVGDIISGNWAESVARFCDLSKPVITMSGGVGAYVCYLAPKRGTY